MAFDGVASDFGNITRPKDSDLSEIAASFSNSPQPHQQTIGAQAFNAAIQIADPKRNNLLTDMIGSNPLNADAARVSASAVGVINSSAAGTKVNAGQAQGMQANLSNHIENTKQAIVEAQKPIREQLDQAFTELSDDNGLMHDDNGNSYNVNHARGSFSSASNNTSDSVQGIAMIGGSMVPGTAGKAMASADVVTEIRSAAGVGTGKLPVKLQNIVAERLAKIQLADHDSGKHPMSEGIRSRIDTALKQSEFLRSQPDWNKDNQTPLTELYEKILQPPENFPEVKEMMDNEQKLGAVVAEHTAEQSSVDVALAVKQTTGVDLSIDEAEFVGSAEIVSVALTDPDSKIPVQQASLQTGGIKALLENAKPVDAPAPSHNNEMDWRLRQQPGMGMV